MEENYMAMTILMFLIMVIFFYGPLIYVFILIIRIFVNPPDTCVSKIGDISRGRAHCNAQQPAKIRNYYK